MEIQNIGYAFIIAAGLLGFAEIMKWAFSFALSLIHKRQLNRK
jgi:hypothetical protein